MLAARTRRTLATLRSFVETPLSALLDRRSVDRAPDAALALFQDVAATVPAYRELFRAHGVDSAAVRTRDDFGRLPVSLWPAGHPEYFPQGVKHRYARK